MPLPHEIITGKSHKEGFKNSESFQPMANLIFSSIKRRILKASPHIEILHVGGTAIPGALTKGDVDIQIRVSSQDFETVSAKLADILKPNNPELWNENLAIFKDVLTYQWKIDVLLTVRYSDEDCCAHYRDMLKSNPALLLEYNQLKQSHANLSPAAYKAAKAAFYLKLHRLRPRS